MGDATPPPHHPTPQCRSLCRRFGRGVALTHALKATFTTVRGDSSLSLPSPNAHNETDVSRASPPLHVLHCVLK